MEKKTVTINGVNYSAEVTHRAMIDFERQSGKPFYQANSLEDADRLMFCALKHGCKIQNIEFPLSFEQFIDYVDTHPEVMDFTTEKKRPTTQINPSMI